MSRPLCPGSAKPPSGNDTGFTGRCSVCGTEFQLSRLKRTVMAHKERTAPKRAVDHVLGSRRFEVRFDRSGE